MPRGILEEPVQLFPTLAGSNLRSPWCSKGRPPVLDNQMSSDYKGTFLFGLVGSIDASGYRYPPIQKRSIYEIKAISQAGNGIGASGYRHNPQAVPLVPIVVESGTGRASVTTICRLEVFTVVRAFLYNVGLIIKGCSDRNHACISESLKHNDW